MKRFAKIFKGSKKFWKGEKFEKLISFVTSKNDTDFNRVCEEGHICEFCDVSILSRRGGYHTLTKRYEGL